MAVRIYSLAKDLGLDSKELVDLCTRIGIQGKGSALASLEDEEIARIKRHIEEKATPAASAQAVVQAVKPVREPIKEVPKRDLSQRIGGANRDLSASRSKVSDSVAAVSKGTAVAVAPETESSVAVDDNEVVSSNQIDDPIALDSREPDTEQESTTIVSTNVDVEVSQGSQSRDVNEVTSVVSEDKPGRSGDGLTRKDFYSPAATSGRVRVLGGVVIFLILAYIFSFIHDFLLRYYTYYLFC